MESTFLLWMILCVYRLYVHNDNNALLSSLPAGFFNYTCILLIIGNTSLHNVAVVGVCMYLLTALCSPMAGVTSLSMAVWVWLSTSSLRKPRGGSEQETDRPYMSRRKKKN